MPLTINDDSNLLALLRQSNINQSEISKRLASIASGLRINQASNDAAGLAVSENLRSQSRGLDMASRNIQDFASLAQTADASLGEVQDMSQRINELAVRASNGTLNADDRNAIQEEISQITQQIDVTASSTEFNGQPLLNGTFKTSTQIGSNPGNVLNLSPADSSSASLGIAGIDVTTQTGAENSIGAVQGATNSIATERAAIGAILNRLQMAANSNGAQAENVTAAESQIRDANVAEEVTALTTAQILQDASLSSVAQGNINRQNSVRLLGS